MFTVFGMVVSLGPMVTKPGGLTYDFVEFAQVGGKQISLRNVVVMSAVADLLALCAIGEFDFEGDVSASLFCGQRRADGPGVSDLVDSVGG